MSHIRYPTPIHLDPGVVPRLRGAYESVRIGKSLVVTDAPVRVRGAPDGALADHCRKSKPRLVTPNGDRATLAATM